MKPVMKWALWLVVLLPLFWSCDDGGESNRNDYLLTVAERNGRTPEELESLFRIAGISGLEAYLHYETKIYLIEYETDYLGSKIKASGLISVPITSEAIPMLSFQHGTITGNFEAPTEDSDYSLLGGLASAGYIFIIPDMIGFGSSSDILHPYYHEELTAGSILDMIRATEELCLQEEINFNGELYLAGYSEGGYATMATHKSIEQHPIDGIELIASAPASGGYDVKGMQEYFFSLETYHQPFYMAYVALSYESVYDWPLTLADFFQEPYASALPEYFDGSLSGSQINSQLTDVVADYLTAEFLEGADTDTKYVPLINAFEENSLDDWTPQKPMFMYHGSADITVPYQNSVDTYEKILSLGASTDVVTFTEIVDATHGSGVFPYIRGFMADFENFRSTANN